MTTPDGSADVARPCNLYVTDTLGNPYRGGGSLRSWLSRSRNHDRTPTGSSAAEPITVVIGNPPTRRRAEGGRLDRERRATAARAPLDRWRRRPNGAWRSCPPSQKSLCLFLALGDVEGIRRGLKRRDRLTRTTRMASSASSPSPAFSMARASRRCATICGEMLRYLGDRLLAGRASADVATRIFQGVQQPVCIVMAARRR